MLVLEQGDDLSVDSKASTFHIPSLELLETLGVVEEMHEQGLKAPVFQQRDRKGGLLAELDLGLLADETAYPWRLQLEQDKLTRIIRPLLLEATGHARDPVRRARRPRRGPRRLRRGHPRRRRASSSAPG